jgi:hypothetical protein
MLATIIKNSVSLVKFIGLLGAFHFWGESWIIGNSPIGKENSP